MSNAAATGRGNSDLILVGLVLGVLTLLFAPVAAPVLDVLILLNTALALLTLLITFYAPRPVDFSTFPALLLVATLFRLALNVSATRLILSDGDAGRVIAAVGSYVVGGNYVIGLIVFLILVVVQYVVVTNGAQRVSEVAARFTLDSIPGQQMSIDADLNMGLIDQDEAKRRRKLLEREAAFYGAMDGASKFVKGDAIAGIVIMLINIIGGLVIGVLQRGMPWGDALQHYTLLTIGDGIVTQIPALVISVGTGLIVTRSASDGQLGGQVMRQLFAYPRTLAVVTAAMLGLSLLPGMPTVPVLAIATLGGAAFYYSRRQAGGVGVDLVEASAKPVEEDPYAIYDLEPIEVRLGLVLARAVGGTQGVLVARVATFRSQFAADTGFVMPKISFREDASLASGGYRIAVYGDAVAQGDVQVDRLLAIHPNGDVLGVPGSATTEPTYGLPALWIEPRDRDRATDAKYTLIDAVSVLHTHLCEVLRRQAAELLTRSQTERMLARLKTQCPGLVEELVPTVLALSDIQKVLQNLMREKVSVRNLQAIVEALIDGARTTKDPALLTEQVRRRLATTICNSLSADRRTLHVLTLDPVIEERLLGVSSDAQADPRWIDTVLTRVAAGAERMLKSNLVPVVLCTPEARRQLRALCERAAPHLRVISIAEVSSGFELRAYSSISAA